VPLDSRVSFSKNLPGFGLPTSQLGELSEGRDEGVHSTRLRAVLRAGVRCLPPLRPVRGRCRLHSKSATSMPRFDYQMSDNRVICVCKNVHREAFFPLQTGRLFVSEVAHG
jgi:hypothetical protein